MFDLVSILYTVPSILSIGKIHKYTQYILCNFILGTVLYFKDFYVIVKYKNNTSEGGVVNGI